MLTVPFMGGCFSSSGNEGQGDGNIDDGIGEEYMQDDQSDIADSFLDSEDDNTPDTLPDFQPWDSLDIDWPEYDLPEVDEDTPVAEPVGPPVVIDDEDHAGGVPSVAWNGSGWGVVWGAEMGAVFRSLDELANPAGPVVLLDPFFDYSIQLEWHLDHYGVVGSHYSVSEFSVGFITIDSEGGLLHGPTLVAEEAEKPDVSWSQEAGGWLIGYVLADGYDYSIFAALVDDQARLLGEPQVVGMGDFSRGPRIVGLKSRNAFFWHRGDGIWHRSFQWPEVDDGYPQQMIMSMPGLEDTYIEVAAFLDYALVVGMDGRDVLAEVVEPWMGSVISGPFVIGSSGIVDRRPGISAVIDRGYLGVCYETGRGPPGGSGDDGLSFRIIDVHGSPLGAPLVIASGLENIGGCAVGWSGSEFIVIYWSCGVDTPSNHIIAQRVQPTI
jgi:hypothetical protein